MLISSTQAPTKHQVSHCIAIHYTFQSNMIGSQLKAQRGYFLVAVISGFMLCCSCVITQDGKYRLISRTQASTKHQVKIPFWFLFLLFSVFLCCAAVVLLLCETATAQGDEYKLISSTQTPTKHHCVPGLIVLLLLLLCKAART
jgi:hypothetical protein